jgi:cytoskeletal protein CcmA (bactofilin family)
MVSMLLHLREIQGMILSSTCFRGKMFKRNKPTPQRAYQTREEPSYIAPNTEFNGNLVTDGEIHIDGLVMGTVQARTCLVGDQGEVQGGILAEIVFIRGRVLGPVSASQVNISARAHVEGNVAHETISIENGAYVLGNISHRSQQLAVTHEQTPTRIFPESKDLKPNLWDKPNPTDDEPK